jgi:hypothetical protein
VNPANHPTSGIVVVLNEGGVNAGVHQNRGTERPALHPVWREPRFSSEVPTEQQILA